MFVVFLASRTDAQICVPIGGSQPFLYNQNFDGFGNSSAPQNGDTSNIFIYSASGPRRVLGKFNNAVSDGGGIVNVPGWALFEEGSSASSVSGRYAVGDGSNNGGNTYLFANSTTPVDRAFGSLTDDSESFNILGGCFVNGHTSAIARVRIGHTGEMYRRGAAGSAVDLLAFQYAVNATDIYTGTFTPYAALNFVTPNISGVPGVRDGNNAGYRTVFPQNNISVLIMPGDRFYIRWLDQNISGADDGLAIDDLSIQFVTTSAALASISGRVTSINGRGLGNILVTLIDENGQSRTRPTNTFGYYRFSALSSGASVIINVRGKNRVFRESSRIVNVNDDLTNLDFVAVQ
jgi:hypothetical protein